MQALEDFVVKKITSAIGDTIEETLERTQAALCENLQDMAVNTGGGSSYTEKVAEAAAQLRLSGTDDAGNGKRAQTTSSRRKPSVALDDNGGDSDAMDDGDHNGGDELQEEDGVNYGESPARGGRGSKGGRGSRGGRASGRATATSGRGGARGGGRGGTKSLPTAASSSSASGKTKSAKTGASDRVKASGAKGRAIRSHQSDEEDDEEDDQSTGRSDISIGNDDIDDYDSDASVGGRNGGKRTASRGIGSKKLGVSSAGCGCVSSN